jgi:hypothetical protein
MRESHGALRLWRRGPAYPRRDCAPAPGYVAVILLARPGTELVTIDAITPQKAAHEASLFKSENVMQPRSPSRAWFHSVKSFHERRAKTVEPSVTFAAPIPINEK